MYACIETKHLKGGTNENDEEKCKPDATRIVFYDNNDPLQRSSGDHGGI